MNRCSGPGNSPGPRGAADAVSFARQQAKIVTGINRLGASIVSLEEVENSAWFGEDRDSALAGLVDALNAAAGSAVWAYAPSPSADKLPPLAQQDVIRTAFIYKPAEVSLVGEPAVLSTESDEGEPFSIAREPDAHGFKKAGASDLDAFLVVSNHWKSKGSGTPLYDGDAEDTSSPANNQGAFNATRVREAQAVVTFANEVAASLGTTRIFLVGDFNSYTHEDPIHVLYEAGYTDLGSRYDPNEHTYGFNDLQGSLDHVLASPTALAMVTGADVWQINAQEAVAYNYSRYNYNATLLFDGSDPFAASDHDPVIVGLNLPSTPAWNATKIYQARRHGRLPGRDLPRTVVDDLAGTGQPVRRLGTDRYCRGRHRHLDPVTHLHRSATRSSTRARSTSPSGGPATRYPASRSARGRQSANKVDGGGPGLNRPRAVRHHPDERYVKEPHYPHWFYYLRGGLSGLRPSSTQAAADLIACIWRQPPVGVPRTIERSEDPPASGDPAL
nr:hypothetical protein GCM10020092_101250 [Actinoplanes digitatis]